MANHGLEYKSKTPESKKDYWNTSDLALSDAKKLLGIEFFSIDVCAKSHKEAKADSFITEDEDALSLDWDFEPWDYFAWCNPPFSRKKEFLAKANEQSNGRKMTVCCMISHEPCTKWWREFVSSKATFVYVPNGRYNFVDDETKKEIHGVNFCSCFVVFTPMYTKEAVSINFDIGFSRAQK